MIIPYQDRYRSGVIKLWNERAVQDGYKEMYEASFHEIFTANPYFSAENTFVLIQDGEVCGFANGCMGDDLPFGDKAGYMTCIVLADRAATDEHYDQLLHRLEQRFRYAGKTQSEVLFFNPIALPWYIPGSPRHEHNNAPGVPVDAALYGVLLRNGYVERARECAMYLRLDQFNIPVHVQSKERKAAELGYRIEMYDPTKHDDVAELLAALRNPLWEKEITSSVAQGIPVVVAAHEGAVVGFAGPVIRETSGRGYFAGIGVHPEHEGHGLGTVLFFKLCEAFQQIGVDYMSLYTGQANPAKRIYESAGFQTVRKFSVMRKVL